MSRLLSYFGYLVVGLIAAVAVACSAAEDPTVPAESAPTASPHTNRDGCADPHRERLSLRFHPHGPRRLRRPPPRRRSRRFHPHRPRRLRRL